MKDEDIIRGASAINQAGSPAFGSHAGATLAQLSEFAERGELEAVSATLLAHAAVHPADRTRLTRSIPAIVLNRYFCRSRGQQAGAVEVWRGRNSGWAEVLKRASANPPRFAAVAAAMADEIEGGAD